MTDPVNDQSDVRSQTALDFAKQWSQLPPEHLRIALRALEPQLAREHEYRMHQLRIEQRRALAGLVAGFALSAALLALAVVVGLQGQVVLSALLAGPSIVAMGRFLVTRQDRTRPTPSTPPQTRESP
ncbi:MULTISPECIES: hypothetical protein [unclassified Streptomyces]|uniref:hypothetical protein n=1 Tax=unclassified Streptomyces TaxID=2593676 RepID=UPI0006B1D3CA|nr:MULTISPECIES: hypothetical protein [unclassified Streptomyces]KOY59061.1 hypothetical protein ADK59_04465 [Streptomyces sp. XY332]THA31367.1 hypothetical protein E6W17_35755 [Streptomyces sp. A1547]